ncbi:MAG: hypothetical protein IKH30_19505 [Clostridia bacterium]|nr:hypothetical protein [Clostridia bacterium]
MINYDIICLEKNVRNYVDFYSLISTSIREREAAITALKTASVYSCGVDVRPDDQLLILVTCVDHDNERRVVAARRVRDGENEQELKNQIQNSWKK